jgi:hypothetical protein
VSFDLVLVHVAGAPPDPSALHAVRTRIAASHVLAGLEIVFPDPVPDPEGGEVVLVGMRSGDDVQAIYAEMRAVAAEHDLRLHNPWSGEDVDLAGTDRAPEGFA